VSLRGSIIDYSYGSGSSRNPAVLLIMDRYKCDLYAAIERRLNRLARYDALMLTVASCIACSALTLLVGRQEEHPACLEQSAYDLHMVQLMPLPPDRL